ncbi:MAG: RidA family protein [Alphaproteobacteria bacterium]|nr:RidA family protein [Alphaproteobacteria bacterium]
MDIKRFDPGPRLSRAVVFGDTVYLAGLTADDASQGVTGQTQQILAKIDHYLKQAGTDKSRLLTAQIWLSDIKTFNDMNKAWEAWVDKANPPARATVESKLAGAGLSVEIMVVAARS